MRRIRQISPALPRPLWRRATAAIAVSAAVHAYLIFGIAPPASVGRVARDVVMHARIVGSVPPAAASAIALPRRQQAARSVTPEPDPAIAPQPPAPAPEREREASADVPVHTPAAAAESRESEQQALPDLSYYAAADVDVYPLARLPIVPAYPQAARDARLSGAVTLLVRIDETGRVEDASVEDAEPAGVFDRAAQQAVAAASFSPAQKDGRRVRSRMLIRVEFDPAAK